MKGPPCIPDGSAIFSEEPDFDSDNLRSDSSRSEDDNAKQVMLGQLILERKRGKNKCTREGAIKWEVGRSL